MGKRRDGKLKGVEVNSIVSTNDGDIVIIEVINCSEVVVCFLQYPNVLTVRAGDIRTGRIKNFMKPCTYGIGYIGVGPYKTAVNGKHTKAYNVWMGMLQRVRCPNSKRVARNYEGTSIDIRWLNYQNFAAWYEQEINKFGPVDFGWEIDKDFLIPGNRMYSPDTCCLIPQSINVLMVSSCFSRGTLPLGVSYKRKRYRASVRMFGKNKNLGVYSTIREAQLAYWSAKFESIHHSGLVYWKYLPEWLAMKLVHFGWEDALVYYGDDAIIWSD